MIALVTGASSGIGRDIARSLAKHGINVIITARRRDRLEKLKKELTETYGVKVHIIAADISDMAQCRELHRRVKKYSIDIFVNNAGFGVFGDLTDTDLDRELAELDVNVKAFHTLFKLFLQDFRKRELRGEHDVYFSARLLSYRETVPHEAEISRAALGQQAGSVCRGGDRMLFCADKHFRNVAAS